MNSGLFGIQASNPRMGWGYVSGPHDIVLNTEMQFDFPATHPIGTLEIRLLCLVSNNGYVAGREVPIAMVTRNTGTADDGQPRWSYQIEGATVWLYLNSTGIAIIPSNGGAAGTFTSTEWQLKLYANA